MVLQADDLGLLFECSVLPDGYISQEVSCAIAVHSTESGLCLFTESISTFGFLLSINVSQ